MDKPHFDHYNQSAPEYVEQILWHRIVATSVVAILIVTGSAWAAYKLFKKPEPGTSIAPGISEITEREKPAEESGMVETSVQSGKSNMPRVSAQPESSTHSDNSSNAEAESTAAVNTPMVAVATTSKSVTETQVQSQAQTSPEPVSPGTYRVSTRIQSDDITRAELADEMVDLEPKEALDNTASLTAPFVKLYFYTDLNGRAGDRLTYTWSRNGEVAARVRIGVGSDRWRSHSSKNINKNMRGDWEVVVTDKQGQTLASSHFVIPEADTTHP